ncbi:MAG: hypothetical protein KG028_15340 [Actinobacteria bacterium]|nr:hypothetical protein [Actinomycetota bacterium]
MRNPGTWLLVAALCLGACADTAADPEGSVDTATFDEAAAAEDLPAALAAGERIADDLRASLDVEPQAIEGVRPYRVSLCDEVRDDAPSLVSVGRGFAIPPERIGDVVEQVRATFEAAGLDGVRVVGEDTDAPLVTALFADDTWQVSAMLNGRDGIGEIRVNSACLPGEVPEPPASSRP